MRRLADPQLIVEALGPIVAERAVAEEWRRFDLRIAGWARLSSDSTLALDAVQIGWGDRTVEPPRLSADNSVVFVVALEEPVPAAAAPPRPGVLMVTTAPRTETRDEYHVWRDPPRRRWYLVAAGEEVEVEVLAWDADAATVVGVNRGRGTIDMPHLGDRPHRVTLDSLRVRAT